MRGMTMQLRKTATARAAASNFTEHLGTIIKVLTMYILRRQMKRNNIRKRR
jgi:hypothetical protein